MEDCGGGKKTGREMMEEAGRVVEGSGTRDAAEQCQLSSSDSEEGSVTPVATTDSDSGKGMEKVDKGGGGKSGGKIENFVGGRRILSKSFYFERQKSLNFGDENPVVLEAFNSELINLHSTNSIPDKPLSDLGPYASLDDYLLTVNQHKKFHRRREKLYFTQGPSKRSWIPQLRWCLILGSLSLLVLGSIGIVLGYTYFTQAKPQRINSFTESILGRPGGTTITENSVFYQTSSSSSSSQFGRSSSESPLLPAEIYTDATWSSTSPSRTTPDSRDKKSSSSFPPVISNNFVSSAADISFTLTNVEFNESLADKGSRMFAEFASTIQSLIIYELENFKGWRGVRARVTEFMPGSIVVKMRISWDDDRKTFGDLRVAISSLRQLGRFYVLPGSSYGIFDLCKLQNHGCSHVCRFDFRRLDFQCFCPLNMELAVDVKTCRDGKQLEELQISSTDGTDIQRITGDEMEEYTTEITGSNFDMLQTEIPDDGGDENPSSGGKLPTFPPPPPPLPSTVSTTSRQPDDISNPVTNPLQRTSSTTPAPTFPRATTSTSETTRTGAPSPGVYESETRRTDPNTDDIEKDKEAVEERPGSEGEGGVISAGIERYTEEPPENIFSSTGAESYENSVTDYMLNVMERTENGYYSQIQGEKQSGGGRHVTLSSVPTIRLPRLGFSNVSRYSEERRNLIGKNNNDYDTSTPSEDEEILGGGGGEEPVEVEIIISGPENSSGLANSSSSKAQGRKADSLSEIGDAGRENNNNDQNANPEREEMSNLLPSSQGLVQNEAENMFELEGQGATTGMDSETTPGTTISLANDTDVNNGAVQEEISAEPIYQSTEASPGVTDT